MTAGNWSNVEAMGFLEDQQAATELNGHSSSAVLRHGMPWRAGPVNEVAEYLSACAGVHLRQVQS